MSLTKEQIARVFAMYWGCEYKFMDVPHIYKLGEDGVTKLALEQGFEDCKLLLKPLSAITDEDAIEVARICEWDVKDAIGNPNPYKIVIKGYLRKQSFGYQPYQYLIQQGYVVPLFIAPNHPDNGKTSIELNLAIDATASKDHTQPNNTKSAAL